MTAEPGRLPVEYVVPLRWSDDADLPEFTDYLRRLAVLVDITVVDGSEREVFAGHADHWGELVRHLPVGQWPGRNRKVAGVVTGVVAARHELVVVADDDVRYGLKELRDMASRLGDADLVRPQNVFRPLPWHARWDTGRMLINRAFGSDYPGTLGVRRSAFVAAGGYDGDVLFENLQLIRTLRAVGAREHRADDLFVERRPPTVNRFLEQRIRQAYDDFAQPGRLVAEALLLPALVASTRRTPVTLPLAAAAAAAVAECGRRRRHGTAAFGPTDAVWAPLWVGERAVTVWLAVLARLRGGVRYRGERMPRAGTRPVRRERTDTMGLAA
ncbi:glycosyltransferase [Nakamurella sp. GG22]